MFLKYTPLLYHHVVGEMIPFAWNPIIFLAPGAFRRSPLEQCCVARGPAAAGYHEVGTDPAMGYDLVIIYWLVVWNIFYFSIYWE